MEDKEVIKALECCLNEDCENCPARMCCDDDTESFVKYVFDLITRQKAEIEELEAEIDKQYEQARSDILGNMADGGTSCHWCIEQHQAKAVKEFAKTLCEGRVSNDPVVIAVMAELNMMEGANG